MKKTFAILVLAVAGVAMSSCNCGSSAPSAPATSHPAPDYVSPAK